MSCKLNGSKNRANYDRDQFVSFMGFSLSQKSRRFNISNELTSGQNYFRFWKIFVAKNIHEVRDTKMFDTINMECS